MQCPRCGLVNTPGISACARCRLPVGQPASPLPDSYHQPPPPAAGTGPPPQGIPQAQPPGAGTGLPPQGYPQPPPPPQGHQFSSAPPPGHQPPPPQAPAGYPALQPPAGYPPAAQPAQPGQPAQPRQPGQLGQSPFSYGQPPQLPPYQPGHSPYASTLPMSMPTGAVATAKPAGGSTSEAVLLIAVLLSLGYAAWAFTARRWIFADFAAGNPVTSGDAESNDLVDTIFLAVVGVVAVIALLLLAKELLSRATGKRGLQLTGLIMGVLAAGVVGVGAFLVSNVADSGTQAEQGDKGVTATWVMGGGFVLLAVGLLVGSMGIRSTTTRPPSAEIGNFTSA